MTMSKNMSDQIGKMLQDEVNDLRTQLAQYEAVSSLKLGIFPKMEEKLVSNDDDADAHDQSVLNATSARPFGESDVTERLHGFFSLETECNNTTDGFSDYIQKLKNELEKCLINNFSKRNRIDKLNKEMEGLTNQISDLKKQQSELEKERRDLELKNAILMQQQTTSTQGPSSMQSETEKLKRDLEQVIQVSFVEVEEFMSD